MTRYLLIILIIFSISGIVTAKAKSPLKSRVIFKKKISSSDKKKWEQSFFSSTPELLKDIETEDEDSQPDKELEKPAPKKRVIQKKYIPKKYILKKKVITPPLIEEDDEVEIEEVVDEENLPPLEKPEIIKDTEKKIKSNEDIEKKIENKYDVDEDVVPSTDKKVDSSDEKRKERLKQLRNLERKRNIEGRKIRQ